MEATRPRSSRRTRRGTVERPIDARLVRNASAFVVVALVIAALTISRPGALAASALPPSFDTATAATLARELTRDYPQREPGSSLARGAAVWFSETLALYGLKTTTDVWRARLPTLGSVELRNVIATVPGTNPGSIVVVAYRDNIRGLPPLLDNASGTAALIELARAYGSRDAAGTTVRPRHRLVFVSTDGGSYGGLGAARFAASALARDALAVIVLDEIGEPGVIRLSINGDASHSPAAALVRTASARIADETGLEPPRAGWLQQLVSLGVPLALGEQAPFLGSNRSALRITSVGDGRQDATRAAGTPLRTERLAETGRAAQALLASIDAGIEIVPEASSYLYLGQRVVRGWALEIVLLATLIPFLVGVIDLLARCRRLGVPLVPAFRALRARLGVALWLGVLVAAMTALGGLPSEPGRPLPAALPAATSLPRLTCLLIGALTLAGWALARPRLGRMGSAIRADEELAGYAAALVGLAAVALLTAAVNPFALTFVLPSLAAWLWLPLLTAGSWRKDLAFGLGLCGPALFLVTTAEHLQIGAGVFAYTLRLFTSGYLSPTTAILLLGWGAVAAQLGALVGERYGPYAAGASPPPPGMIRTATSRIAAWHYARRRNGTSDPAATGAPPRST